MMWRYRHHRVGTGPVLVHCGMLHYDVMTEERLTHYWSLWVESQIFELTNPTVNHTPQCTIKKMNVHISVLNGALWDKGQVHYWICNLDFGMVCRWPLLGLLFPVIMPSLHYSDVTMNAMAYQITGVSNVCSIVYSGADLRNNKAPRHGLLWVEFTAVRWIHLTKGQQRGKVSIWWRHHVRNTFGDWCSIYKRVAVI